MYLNSDNLSDLRKSTPTDLEQHVMFGNWKYQVAPHTC